jgi:hypothetical protein
MIMELMNSHFAKFEIKTKTMKKHKVKFCR